MRHFFKLFLFFIFSSYSFADNLIIEPDAGRAPLLQAIDNAKSSIDIVMYGFTDEEFVKALIHAKTQQKKIIILLEPSPYKSATENNRVIRRLNSENINLKWPSKTFQLTHQKTFMFDHTSAIVMTFNLTRGSFSNQRNFAITLENPEEVQEINRVFLADCLHQKISVTQPDLVWSPDNSREKILRLIQTAHSDIKIYAQDITDYQLIGALAKAARAGKEIKILLSADPKKLKNRKLSFLKKAGVMIHNSRDYYIHAKVMIVDQQRALVGSINFTKASLDDNRELSVITEDQKIVQQLDETFDQDWKS
jgi:cardiolipin synthase